MSLCTIKDIAFGGEGVGRIDNLVVFVPFTAPADVIELKITQRKKSFARAEMLHLIEAGPDRIPAPCPYYQVCGGCQFQHLTYEAQLEIKRKFIEEALARIAKISYNVPPVRPSSKLYGYRRHITLKMKGSSHGWVLGFSSASGQDLLSIRSCLLLQEETSIVEDAQQLVQQFLPHSEGQGSLKILKGSNGLYIFALDFDSSVPSNLQQVSAQFLSGSNSCSGIICRSPDLGFELGETSLHFSYQGFDFSYSPFGFVQNHPEQSANIYDLASSWAEESKRVLDLYCGIGITSLAMARKAEQVIGIELSADAIYFAKLNAKNNHCKNVEFYCSPVESITKKIIAKLEPDTVLINPPRTGIEKEVVLEIIKANPEKIIYISCYPSTLARDLREFSEKGYTIADLQGFDMFPQTTHVETAVLLTKDPKVGRTL
jgi:23S rRNA (uracil1939-C5)-methyltransferase